MLQLNKSGVRFTVPSRILYTVYRSQMDLIYQLLRYFIIEMNKQYYE